MRKKMSLVKCFSSFRNVSMRSSSFVLFYCQLFWGKDGVFFVLIIHFLFLFSITCRSEARLVCKEPSCQPIVVV